MQFVGVLLAKLTMYGNVGKISLASSFEAILSLLLGFSFTARAEMQLHQVCRR
jgi:hypothetical protein